MHFLKINHLFYLLLLTLLVQCGSVHQDGSMTGPSERAREEAISKEPAGNFYYGRRYYVKKTRFWGYLRQPRQNANMSKLVIMQESIKKCPDRLIEDEKPGASYGYDQNYEYRIWGRYTGREVYDINSNQFLPEFQLKDYQIIDKNPGWLFSPRDRYDNTRITLIPR